MIVIIVLTYYYYYYIMMLGEGLRLALQPRAQAHRAEGDR